MGNRYCAARGTGTADVKQGVVKSCEAGLLNRGSDVATDVLGGRAVGCGLRGAVGMMKAEQDPCPGRPLVVNRSVSAAGVVRPGMLPVGLDAGALRPQGNMR